MLDERAIPEQGSAQWHADRAGKLTASEFVVVGAGTEAARDHLMLVLAFERLSGKPRHSISAASLKWGNANESPARRAYEDQAGTMTAPSGFVLHPDYPFIGASPDFRVPPNGGGEIKSPLDEAVHLRTWRDGMPPDHMWQVQGGMMCTGADWWDFCSFHPDAPPNLRLYRQRIFRDQVFIDELLESLLLFETRVRATVKALDAKGRAAMEFVA